MENLFGSLAPQPRQEVRRGLFAPLVEYDDKSVEVGWPDAIMAPARSIWGMLQPGYSDEFMQRNTPPETMKRMAGDGLNAAGFVGGASALVPRPANAVGIFGGRLAKTADQAALAKAEQMASQGVPREQIWNETGWFQGVDGKWRFEIDDSQTSIGRLGPWFERFNEYGYGQSGSGPLDSVLRDGAKTVPPYPGVGIEKVVITRGDANGLRVPGFITASADDEGMLRSILLHEKQHAIQDAERFARGGTSREFTPADVLAERDKLLARSQSGDLMDEAVYAPAARQVSAKEMYNRLAGEVEARTVQKRMDLTPEQRRARAPWLDYDVPEDQQIVRFR